MACMLTERDGSCEPSTRSVRPEVWREDGHHGPGTVLRLAHEDLERTLGRSGPLPFYKEGQRASFVPDVFEGEPRLVLDDSGARAGFWEPDEFTAASTDTCLDLLGTRSPSGHSYAVGSPT